MINMINFLAFQGAWFACVLGGANDLPWLGVAVVTGVLVFHLLSSPEPGNELALVAAVAAIGMAWDSVLTAGGVLVYPSGMLVPWLAPYWILAMWLAFATTLNRSLSWLHGRLWLASVLGAIAGPLAYYGGSALGGVAFENALSALVAQSLGWSILLPLFVFLATRLEGARARDRNGFGSAVEARPSV